MPTTRDAAHAAGRLLTRVLLHPRWRNNGVIQQTYLELYLLGKRLTEHREVASMRTLLEPGMVVADIGANVGFYTLEMASIVGSAGRVLAFEPDPLSGALLERRVALAGAKNVEVHRLGLGERAGQRTLHCSAYNRADNRLHPSHHEPHTETCVVEVRSLDEILADRGVGALDAIKIDVQGAEEEVLLGARATLRRGLKWIWIEFSPEHLRGAGTEPGKLLSFLEGLGMSIFEVGANGRFEALSQIQSYEQKIGSSYGDLVLMAAAPSARQE
jgi:FkbM family methyltransferase